MALPQVRLITDRYTVTRGGQLLGHLHNGMGWGWFVTCVWSVCNVAVGASRPCMDSGGDADRKPYHAKQPEAAAYWLDAHHITVHP